MFCVCNFHYGIPNGKNVATEERDKDASNFGWRNNVEREEDCMITC